MNATKRSQNKCDACGYTWYPRGKDKSLKCPSCGSNNVSIVNVSIVGGGGLILLTLFIGGVIFANNKDTPPEASPQEVKANVATQSVSIPPITEKNDVAASDVGESKTLAPDQEAVVPNNSSERSEIVKETIAPTQEIVAPISNEAASNEPVEKTIESPTEICKNETNFFFKNNCMWRECEKPKFTDLQECENKKPNRNPNDQ